MNTKFYALLLLGLNACALQSALDFNSIDLAKISDKTRDIAMSLSDTSVEAIKKKAQERLKDLPNEAFGINILELKENVGADVINQLEKELPNLYDMAQNVKPFLNDPQTALMLITTLYTVMASQIPQSISNLYISILAFAKKIVDSTKAEDIAAVDAIKNIVAASNGIIDHLYNNRDNLAQGIKTAQFDAFKTTVQNNIEPIRKLIERNGAELQNIAAKARNISAEDIKSFEQTFKTGFETARNVLS